MAMSDRVMLFNGGIIQQVEGSHSLYVKPENQFVAAFIGLANFFKGDIIDGSGGNKR